MPRQKKSPNLLLSLLFHPSLSNVWKFQGRPPPLLPPPPFYQMLCISSALVWYRRISMTGSPSEMWTNTTKTAPVPKDEVAFFGAQPVEWPESSYVRHPCSACLTLVLPCFHPNKGGSRLCIVGDSKPLLRDGGCEESGFAGLASVGTQFWACSCGPHSSSFWFKELIWSFPRAQEVWIP